MTLHTTPATRCNHSFHRVGPSLVTVHKETIPTLKMPYLHYLTTFTDLRLNRTLRTKPHLVRISLACQLSLLNKNNGPLDLPLEFPFTPEIEPTIENEKTDYKSLYNSPSI